MQSPIVRSFLERSERSPLGLFGLDTPSGGDRASLKRDLDGGKRILLRRPSVYEIRSIDKKAREVEVVASTSGVKRDGNAIFHSEKAWDFRNFEKNPAMLWSHDYGSAFAPPGLPLGYWKTWGVEKTKAGSALIMRGWFEEDEFPEKVWRRILSGTIRAVSIGWNPLEFEELKDDKGRQVGWNFTLNELYECSWVVIGADPDAGIRGMYADLKPEELDVIANGRRAHELSRGVAYMLDHRDAPEEFLRSIVNLPKESEMEAGGSKLEKSAARPATRALELSGVARRAQFCPGGEDSIRWNPQLSRAFDVTRERYEAGDPELALAARYLDCEIRDLWQTHDMIPSARMGAFLTALDETLGDWTVDDVRRIEMRQGRAVEFPPVHDVIRLNSKQQAEFIVDGSRFMHSADAKAVFCIYPDWGGLGVRVYAARERREHVAGWMSRTKERAKEFNFLRGEAFSLSGQFLERGTESWDDLFLSGANASALQRQIDLINEKGTALPSRGIILMGPPGTGKTLAGRVMMNQANATFIWISARDFFYSGAFGGFTHGFDLARECAPAILFIEDVDNWLGERTIDLLKTEMDGISQKHGVVTVLTTNFPERLPRALIDRPGRFHDVLQIDLPDDSARGRMLSRWLPDLTDEKIRADVIASTSGYSGAHMRELANFASVLREQDGLPLEAAISRALEKITEQRDLINAVQVGKPFVPSRAVADVVALAARSFSPDRHNPTQDGGVDMRALEGIDAELREMGVTDADLPRFRALILRVGKKMASKRLQKLKSCRDGLHDVITECEEEEGCADPEMPEDPETASAPTPEVTRDVTPEVDPAEALRDIGEALVRTVEQDKQSRYVAAVLGDLLADLASVVKE